MKWQKRLSIILATVNLVWSLIVCFGLYQPAISPGTVGEISVSLVVGTLFIAGLMRVLIGACCAAVFVSLVLPAVSHGPDATPEVVIIPGIVAGIIAGAIWHDSDWPSRSERKYKRAAKRRVRSARARLKQDQRM